MNRFFRIVILAFVLFLLPTSVLVAHSDITLENIAKALDALTDRVDGQ